ncbi:hypothetical protein [Burkholderia oklahomensis]|uniref:hypothetical protein n=1 Tax=Burkholderia oklahomensis TaxID=342113 RepID=UPI0012F50E10|nr:hypothetical protein [Burkholderia oklahomensis]MBI0358859.1 hypothetical protein [Burkholderia oklahomensis]
MLDVDEDVRFVNGIEFVRSFLRCLMMKVKGNIESSFFIHLNMNFHKFLWNILFAMWIWNFNMKGNGGCRRSDDRGRTIARTPPCLRTCRRHQDPRGGGVVRERCLRMRIRRSPCEMVYGWAFRRPLHFAITRRFARRGDDLRLLRLACPRLAWARGRQVFAGLSIEFFIEFSLDFSGNDVFGE